MEGTYGVYFGSQLTGKVQVLRQGLYYRFICRCQLTGDVVCRLTVNGRDKWVSLGKASLSAIPIGITSCVSIH